MSLKAARDMALAGVRDGLADEDITRLAVTWFEKVKQWEAEESFRRAFEDNRMTARVSNDTKAIKFNVAAAHGGTSPMVLDASLQGVLLRTDPQNFVGMKKYEMGLHDLAAVLLAPKRLSLQLFTTVKRGGGVVFMPIPEEGDLQLFAELSQAAKRDRTGKLYAFVVETRTQFTRLKFGSPNDMTLGFLDMSTTPDKQKIVYGGAMATGAVVHADVLKQRSVNAQYYKSAIAGVTSTEGNNEVTVAYRSHAGLFPMFGAPTGDGTYQLFSPGTGLMGILSDEGKITSSFARKTASSSSSTSSSSTQAVTSSATDGKVK